MLKYFILLIIIFTFGCAGKPQVEYIYVPQKCQIPVIVPPTYDNITKNDSPQQVLQKIINNYAACREYSDNLEKAVKVCQ